jgi:hypothetical protein
MVLGISDVREIVERACARQDVIDACSNRDLSIVIEVLGGHGVTQGQIAGLTGISGSAERVQEAQAQAESRLYLREVR